MATGIQRLRYFDGEFLRGADLSAEQSYHVDMRRALTLGLHASGIVKGLVLQQDADSVPPDLLFFSVSAGLAIDQQGREIAVTAPYQISSDNVLKRAGLQAGDSEVWIVYDETAADLPAPGEASCKGPAPNTRILESFQVLLKPKGVKPPKGTKDPDVDLGGVRLGTITLKNDPINGWTVSAADSIGRTYVGVRALSVTSPDEVDTVDPFKPEAQNVAPPAAGKRANAPLGYLDMAPSLFARGNAFMQGSAVLGDDFKLDNVAYPKLPAPGAFKPNGNLKVAGDLFLSGNFYGFLDGGWLGLGDYIRGLIPDVQTGQVEFDLSSPTGATSGDTKVSLTTALASYKFPPQFSVSIAGFKFVSDKNFSGMLSSNPNEAIEVQARGSAIRTGPQSLDLDVSWTLGPDFLIGGNEALPLVYIRIAYVVVFTPGP